MLELCKGFRLRNVTFAVRAIHAYESPAQMRRLLQASSRYTLTVWGEADGRLERFVFEAFEKNRVFADLDPTHKGSKMMASVMRNLAGIF